MFGIQAIQVIEPAEICFTLDQALTLALCKHHVCPGVHQVVIDAGHSQT